MSVAQRCPPNFTGADIYALCADAWFHAAKRSVNISAPMLCKTLLFLSFSLLNMTYFQVQTLETDSSSRDKEASADEIIVEIDDFMMVKPQSFTETTIIFVYMHVRKQTVLGTT